ncbi:hypothetical protein, partial [Nostoc sp. 2RC]|uniref:hypothetical protein n=1 Tax=Nostoc sp. 2RC TaxID=2485484 RepID=UPI001C8B0873
AQNLEITLIFGHAMVQNLVMRGVKSHIACSIIVFSYPVVTSSVFAGLFICAFQFWGTYRSSITLMREFQTPYILRISYFPLLRVMEER